MAVGQNQWYHVGVGAPPIVEPILVGIGSSLGVRDFDPLPFWEFLKIGDPSRWLVPLGFTYPSKKGSPILRNTHVSGHSPKAPCE